jgi:hypothetical protein
MKMTLFLANGATLRFEKVLNLKQDADRITFNYTSVSDGREKSAVFQKFLVAGISTWEEKA